MCSMWGRVLAATPGCVGRCLWSNQTNQSEGDTLYQQVGVKQIRVLQSHRHLQLRWQNICRAHLLKSAGHWSRAGTMGAVLQMELGSFSIISSFLMNPEWLGQKKLQLISTISGDAARRGEVLIYGLLLLTDCYQMSSSIKNLLYN